MCAKSVLKLQRLLVLCDIIYSKMAERMGFEPTIRSPAYTLSKRAPSTTRPPFLIQPSKQR